MNHELDRVVIDTNVLIVANAGSEQADPACVISAVDYLERIRSNGIVVLDQMQAIMTEYRRHCSFRGQPGVGDRFFLHLHNNQANGARVALVNPAVDLDGNYLMLPVELHRFDPSDKKFIAAVIADDRRSHIVNCVDSDWRESEDALRSASIIVEELCE